MGNGRECLELLTGRPAPTGKLVERLAGKERGVSQGSLPGIRRKKVETRRKGGTRPKKKKRRGRQSVSSGLSYLSAVVSTGAAAAQCEAGCLSRQVRQNDQNYHSLMGTYYVPGTMSNTLNILFKPAFTESKG